MVPWSVAELGARSRRAAPSGFCDSNWFTICKGKASTNVDTNTDRYTRKLNLRHGVEKGESLNTCTLFTLRSRSSCLRKFVGTAGAGSLILEFATLSRLTGDERFEKAAYKAYFALWNRRSDIGLVGNTINIWTGVGFLLYDTAVDFIGTGMDPSRSIQYRCWDRFVL